jgi:hypothetical protein
MERLEGMIPVCCWYLQAQIKVRRRVQLTTFNQNCYDNCDGLNPQCGNYHPDIGSNYALKIGGK